LLALVLGKFSNGKFTVVFVKKFDNTFLRQINFFVAILSMMDSENIFRP